MSSGLWSVHFRRNKARARKQNALRDDQERPLQPHLSYELLRLGVARLCVLEALHQVGQAVLLGLPSRR